MLSNPNYPKIGAAVRCCSWANLLNINGHDMQPVDHEFLHNLAKLCEFGKLVVGVTVCLYLLFDKLPKISRAEMTATEVEAIEKSMTDKQVIPPVLLKALHARAKGQGST